jgi:hypothetical protein
VGTITNIEGSVLCDTIQGEIPITGLTECPSKASAMGGGFWQVQVRVAKAFQLLTLLRAFRYAESQWIRGFQLQL